MPEKDSHSSVKHHKEHDDKGQVGWLAMTLPLLESPVRGEQEQLVKKEHLANTEEASNRNGFSSIYFVNCTSPKGGGGRRTLSLNSSVTFLGH